MLGLYVVATPIGNLSDLTARAREALSACDLVAAEDTRVTGHLLNYLNLKKPLISCHRHNEGARCEPLVQRMLSENLQVALCCDAGTPGISDPGAELVAACRLAGIPVTPIPGPSAVTTLLSAAGLDAREFAFYGFLPREKKALKQKLLAIRESGIPLFVVYESPHRVADLIGAIGELFPDAQICLGSDLTKLYERVLSGSPEDILRALAENPNAEKGEYCAAVKFASPPPKKEENAQMPTEARIFLSLLAGKTLDEAAREAADAGESRNGAYRAKLRVQKFLRSRGCAEEEREGSQCERD